MGRRARYSGHPRGPFHGFLVHGLIDAFPARA